MPGELISSQAEQKICLIEIQGIVSVAQSPEQLISACTATPIGR